MSQEFITTQRPSNTSSGDIYSQPAEYQRGYSLHNKYARRNMLLATWGYYIDKMLYPFTPMETIAISSVPQENLTDYDEEGVWQNLRVEGKINPSVQRFLDNTDFLTPIIFGEFDAKNFRFQARYSPVIGMISSFSDEMHQHTQNGTIDRIRDITSILPLLDLRYQREVSRKKDLPTYRGISAGAVAELIHNNQKISWGRKLMNLFGWRVQENTREIIDGRSVAPVLNNDTLCHNN